MRLVFAEWTAGQMGVAIEKHSEVGAPAQHQGRRRDSLAADHRAGWADRWIRLRLQVGEHLVKQRGLRRVDEPLATAGTRDLLAGARVQHQLVVDVHLESVAYAHVYVADVGALSNQRGRALGITRFSLGQPPRRSVGSLIAPALLRRARFWGKLAKLLSYQPLCQRPPWARLADRKVAPRPARGQTGVQMSKHGLHVANAP